MARSALMEWVEARATRDHDTGCLIWKLAGAHGGLEPQGRYLGQIIRVRRALVEEKRGYKLDIGVTVKARCETEMCVEYKHLIVKKRLGRKGQKWTVAERGKIAEATRASRRAKLTEAAIEDIRRKELPREAYAEKYDIAREYVSDIQSHRAWRDYSSPFAALTL
jgi:hypothetical protein